MAANFKRALIIANSPILLSYWFAVYSSEEFFHAFFPLCKHIIHSISVMFCFHFPYPKTSDCLHLCSVCPSYETGRSCPCKGSVVLTGIWILVIINLDCQLGWIEKRKAHFWVCQWRFFSRRLTEGEDLPWMWMAPSNSLMTQIEWIIEEEGSLLAQAFSDS
jgi:hypothetical protein